MWTHRNKDNSHLSALNSWKQELQIAFDLAVKDGNWNEYMLVRNQWQIPTLPGDREWREFLEQKDADSLTYQNK